MSQREGAPRGTFSKILLNVISCITCSTDHNEWQTVWQSHNAQPPPKGVNPYNPQIIKRKGFDTCDITDPPLYPLKQTR